MTNTLNGSRPAEVENLQHHLDSWRYTVAPLTEFVWPPPPDGRGPMRIVPGYVRVTVPYTEALVVQVVFSIENATLRPISTNPSALHAGLGTDTGATLTPAEESDLDRAVQRHRAALCLRSELRTLRDRADNGLYALLGGDEGLAAATDYLATHRPPRSGPGRARFRIAAALYERALNDGAVGAADCNEYVRAHWSDEVPGEDAPPLNRVRQWIHQARKKGLLLR